MWSLPTRQLSKDTSLTIHKEIIKILQDFKNNKFHLWNRIHWTKPHRSNSPAARFYGLPKIHKKQHAYVPHSFSLWHSKHTTLPNSSLKFFKMTVARLHPLLKIVQISSRKFKHLSINPERRIFSLIGCQWGLYKDTSTCSTTRYQFQNFYLHQFHQYLQDPYRKNSSFWNSLSPTASSASTRSSINNYRLQLWFHLSLL